MDNKHNEDDYIEGFLEEELTESSLTLSGPHGQALQELGKAVEDMGDALAEVMLEPLADLMHQIWTHWMKYLYSKLEEDDLGMVISWPDYNHWKQQMETDYSDLLELEKDSDREQAKKIIIVLRTIDKELDNE